MDSKLFVDLLPKFEDFLLDIHTAASIGCDELVREIIESSDRKDIVDDHNKKGWTPLMYAASCANLKVALLLLEENAEPDIKNVEGKTALLLASKCGSSDVVNLLIDNGACVNERDLRERTALFYAIASGHRSVVQLLIERGAFIDIVDYKEGVTPLMLAAEIGHERIVQDLLQMGINVNTESKSGDTARSLALRNGHMNVKYLIDTYIQSKRKIITPSLQSLDLPSIFKELQLTKYYPLFKNHDIDLHSFWLLTDDDLKEIGIHLLGPRKKICMAISQYHQEQSKKNAPKEAASFDSILMENKKLHLYTEKLKTMVLQEQQSKITAECNLADSIQTIKKYDALIKSYLDQMIDVLEKLKEYQDYLRNLISGAFQDMSFSRTRHLKFKVDSILQCLDSTQNLVEIQLQNFISLQQNNHHK